VHNKVGLLLILSASAAAAAVGPAHLPAALPRASSLPIVALLQSGLQGRTSDQIARPVPAIAADIARWNSLRQSDSLPFSSYASFLTGHRGWPGEIGLRRAAERQADPSANASEVARFFEAFPPLTTTGHARYALALQALGRRDEAAREARAAWTGGVLPLPDEQRLPGAFGGALTQADNDTRMDVLLSNGDTQSAARTLTLTSAARRPVFETRLALQTRASDAATRLAALGDAGAGDPGLLADRAVWMRANSDSNGARQLLARPRHLDRLPANPEKFMEVMVAMARAAAHDGQWTTAWQIASQVDDIFAPGTDVSTRSYGERDEYTNLTWLAGRTAMRLGRPTDAAVMFDHYGHGAQSVQTRSKGFYWAARAATAAGQTAEANAWLEQAASSPDQFYGQLALERLGRGEPAPVTQAAPTTAERAAFERRPLVEAIRYLGSVGNRADQTLFVRALADTLDNDRDRELASAFGRSIGRLDIGVWAAREARGGGDSFYARGAFPSVQIPPAYSRYWALAHGIMRQESSFERTAVSHAGARGLMQLMPGTARQASSRLGLSYALSRLTGDPQYNVMLGTHHLSTLMDEWGGNAVLVAAAYNAGSGNVRRWVAANGDPRLPGVDVVGWIEDIPFSETRNYVQRVIENTVVYDTIDPNTPHASTRGRISNYLGRRPN
jgi:soluble lytic murein transglycosylase